MIYKNKEISIPKENFSPPFWCINGHSHTIGSSLFRKPVHVPYQEITITTPDNDFLDADWIDNRDTRATIILLHGLEGSSRRYYIRELMDGLCNSGYSVLALNFRGCSGRMNKKRRFYHSGETEDLNVVIKWIQEKKPYSAIGAVGFSLGGNVLLKYLGERGLSAQLDAAIAISVPYDLKKGSLAIGRGFNKIYQLYFLHSLKKKLAAKRQKYPDLPVFAGKTLYDFDDQVTSVLHGFANADDYYRECSSKFFIEPIRKPALLIHAKDDPLCHFDIVPLKKIRKNSYLLPLFTEAGGHVGFWSHPPGWLKRRIIDYFNQIL